MGPRPRTGSVREDSKVDQTLTELGRDPFARRAHRAWEALLRTCSTSDDGAIVLREGPSRRKPAAVWPLGQALAAAADLWAIDGDRGDTEGLLLTLRRYRDPDDHGFSPTPGARRRYYDDNAWIGLVYAQLHLQTGEERFLRQARRTLGFVRRGEDPAGGVRWVEKRRSRNTCATAPAAQLALRVHLITGDPHQLAFAERSMDWLDANLRRPDGLYADRIDGRGHVEPAVWSYNQGSAAGAHLLRWIATEDTDFAERGHYTAAAALRFLRSHDRLWRQPPVFNAVCFRNLLALDASGAPVDGLFPMLDDYLERAWSTARDPASGLFTQGGIGSYDGEPAIDQAGLVQLFALRAWPMNRRPKIG